MFTVSHEMHFSEPWRVIAPAGYVAARTHDKAIAEAIALAMNAHADMLAALKLVLMWGDANSGADEPDYVGLEEVIADVRAAIAKARGEG